MDPHPIPSFLFSVTWTYNSPLRAARYLQPLRRERLLALDNPCRRRSLRWGPAHDGDSRISDADCLIGLDFRRGTTTTPKSNAYHVREARKLASVTLWISVITQTARLNDDSCGERMSCLRRFP